VSGASRQLILDLPHQPRYAREEFLVAPANAEALTTIDSWPDWPGRMLLLIGPAGAGKSHLGAIWAQRAGAVTINGSDLAGADLPTLGAARATLVDDADQIGAAEAALFHLVNLVRERDAFLMLTASRSPDGWGLETADLLSRLRLAPMAALAEPDDALAYAVLVKLFNDRQLVVEPAVIHYVALRIERSLDAARAIVGALDREALSRGRAVTRPMAAAVLKEVAGAGSDSIQG
jgi:chromosomal replication initiation ATPase DnaA